MLDATLQNLTVLDICTPATKTVTRFEV